MRTRPHANFREVQVSGPGGAWDLLSPPPIVSRQCRSHGTTSLAESTATFFRRSTPRRPSASTVVAPIFATRSQLRDRARMLERTVDRSALHRHSGSLAASSSLIDRGYVIANFYRDSARRLRKPVRNTRKRVGQVETDEPDLPTALAKVPFAPPNYALMMMLMIVCLTRAYCFPIKFA